VRVVGVLAAVASAVLSIALCCALLLWLLPARAGFTLVRVRFTPYWRITRGRGCVMRSAAGWTPVYALSSGRTRVEAAFDPRRLVTHSARCTAPRENPGSEL
jgi:hypothetical protein